MDFGSILERPMPEPEVVKADVGRARRKALAALVAQYISDNEPLLTAKADGESVIVSEKGGKSRWLMTVVDESGS